MDWNLISFVTSGTLRFKVLTTLLNSNCSPSELSEELNRPISNISLTLKELESKGLVKCLTPERRKSKYFKLTDKGEDVINQINSLTRKGGKS